jgi:DNA-binding MarR family transcriptional regulator
VAHVRLLPFLLEHSGISATELASRVGVSKQAVQPLVEDFVHAGYVRRVADEKDGRAKRLYLTRAGLMTMNAGTAILEALETELLNGVRKRDVENVKSTLRYLLRRLEERDAE